jgi:hypothetical protein
MMDRRTFLQGALLAVTPAITTVPPFLSTHSANSDAAQPSSPQAVDGAADLAPVAFAIQGWEQIASRALDERSEEDPVFIAINQSWRCAWR